MVTTYTVALKHLLKYKWWHKKLNKSHHTTDIYHYNKGRSHHKGEGEKGNIAIKHSGQNDYGTNNSGNPDDALVLHNNWCGTWIHKRGLVNTPDNVSNNTRDT